jgi:hypothetical protein
MSQHPAGHDVASHLHVPPEHSWPAAQGAPPPHVHMPDEEQPSPVLPQLTHAAPLVPQNRALVEPTHCVPEQQPLGHDIGSQMQWPAEHTWPVTHDEPLVPHEHAPEDRQRSASVVSHMTHPAPSVPQLEVEEGLHVPPEQQPLGHEALSHVQAPPTQCCPEPQGGLVPQVQEPAEHMSAVKGLHAVHATPLVPHVMNDDGLLHVGPEQQPVAQLVTSHPVQVPEDVQVPGLHDWHMPPPLPHTVLEWPVWHVPLPSQQPVGQEVALQTHVPLLEHI